MDLLTRESGILDILHDLHEAFYHPTLLSFSRLVHLYQWLHKQTVTSIALDHMPTMMYVTRQYTNTRNNVSCSTANPEQNSNTEDTHCCLLWWICAATVMPPSLLQSVQVNIVSSLVLWFETFLSLKWVGQSPLQLSTNNHRVTNSACFNLDHHYSSPQTSTEWRIQPALI